MNRNAWIFGFCLLLGSCQPSATSHSEKSVEEIMTSDKFTNADLIRNPASANEPADTVNVAKMVFAEKVFNFGDVIQGEVVTHVFKFTNEGRVPLVITHARSTCGCTVPEWPDTPVPPGGRGEIKVQFNTAGKGGPQNKPVNIIANTYPSLTTVNLVGGVRPKPAGAK
jgi:hypothetical protein